MESKTTHSTNFLNTLSGKFKGNRTANLVSMWLTVLLTVLMSTNIWAQASISSDEPDYQPGSIATFTGAGFQAGESVQINVLHSLHPEDNVGDEHEPWNVIADSSGNFTTTWQVSQTHCFGMLLRATAIGQSSGENVWTEFTDPTITSTASGGNWSSVGTWFGGVIPGVNDDVYIAIGAIVNVTDARSAKSITLNGGNGNTNLNISSGIALTVSGDVTINAPGSNNRTNTIAVGSGTLNVGGNLTVTGGGTVNRLSILTISTGSVDVNGTIANANSTSSIIFSGACALNIGGNWSNSGTFTPYTSSVIFDGATQSIGGTSSTTFNNLILSGGTKTFGAARTISENLSINSGAIANLGAFSHTANTLTLGGINSPSGTWGSTSSSATHTNNTYFAATTGIVTVDIGPCIIPSSPSSGGNQTVCSTSPIQTLTATATAPIGATIVWYDALSGGNVVPNPTWNQIGAKTYYAESQIGSACVSTSRTPVTLTINPLPTTVTVSVGGAFCGSTTITASNGSSGTIYFQGTTSGSTSTATPSSSETITTSGTYYFRAQSSSGCWGTEGSVVVTINPLPTVVAVTGTGTFCGSTTVTASNGSSGTIYFQGTTSGGTSIATATTSQTINSSGTYYFRARSAAGCWGTEGSVVVIINQIPTATLTTGNQGICQGESITLSITLVGTGTISGTLNDGTPFSGVAGTISIVQTPLTETTYSIASVTNNICSGTFNGSSVITFNGKYIADAGADQTICPNTFATLNGSVTGGPPPPSASWTKSGTGTFGSVSSAVTTYTPSAADIVSGSVTLTLTASGAGNCNASDSMILTFHSLPTISAQPNPVSTTYGNGNVSFSVTASGTALSYQWQVNTGSGFASISGETNALLTVANPTVAMSGYTYRAVVSGTCSPSATSNEVSLTVNKALLTITAANQTVTYGTALTTVTGAGSYTPTGFVNSENSSVIGGTATYTTTYTATTAAASTGVTITPVVTALTSTNYSFIAANGQITVGTKALEVIAVNQDKEYGSLYTYDGTEFTTIGLANSDAVASATISSTGSVATAAVGPYDILISDAVGTGLSNYAITYTKKTLTVGTKALLITANNQSKTYGETKVLGTTAFTAPDLESFDAISGITLTSSGSVNTATVTTPGPTYPIVASLATGSGLANYNISYANGSLTVAKAELTVTANPQTKVYGSANPSPLTATISGFVLGQNLANSGVAGTANVTTLADANSVVGSYILTPAIGTLTSSNYSFKFVNGSLSVTKAVLTVTANPQNKYCGQVNPSALTATITGYVIGQTLATSGVTGNASITTSADANSVVGSYELTSALGALTCNNYSFNFVHGTLKIIGVNIDASASSTPISIGSVGTLKATVSPLVTVPGLSLENIPVKFTLVDGNGVISFTYDVSTDENGFATKTTGILNTAVVYKVTAVVGNDCNNSVAYLPVYDPDGGFVTGGGWINSPSGALIGTTITGKANFGFNAKYKTGKNNTTEVDGNTEFQFSAGNFNFKSSSHDNMSLVISGEKKATYRGIGTVNGAGSHKFMVTVIDGDAPGVNGKDMFRIKVWANNSSNIMYDNETGKDDNADASTVLGGGSIVIHKPKGKGNTSVKAAQPIEIVADLSPFNITAYPNPSADYFTLKLQGMSYEASQKVEVNVFDLVGRQVYSKQGSAQDSYEFGQQFQVGVYLVTVKQGNNIASLKVIKK